MRICIVTQWFPPEHVAAGHMLSDLASHMADSGHDVTVITGFPNHPSGVVFEGYRRRCFQEERVGGFRLWRVFSLISRRKGMLWRTLTSLTFALSACIQLLFRKRFDIVFCVLQPLTIGVTIPLAAKVKGSRLVFNLQDIHPDALIELGLLKNRGMITMLRWIERFSYRRADLITVICERFREHVVSKGVPGDKVKVVENWIDLEAITPGDRGNGFRDTAGLSREDFVVLYAGTIGHVSGAGVVLEAAGYLRDHRDIQFLFVGEGPLAGDLKAASRQKALGNVRFLPFQDRSILSDVQAVSDVSLVTMQRGKSHFSVPSKVLGYMAGARPVVASVEDDSETARQVSAAECGIVTEAGDGKALADAILRLRADPEQRERLGKNGRAFVERNLGRETILDRYSELLESLTGRK